MNVEAEPELENAPACAEPSWADVVERVRAGDQSGMEELYHTFSKGIRYLIHRQLGPQDLDDKVHDIYLIVTESIRRGDLRDPERLMGYVRTIVHRQVALHINNVVQARRNHDLESGVGLPDHQPNPERTIIRNLDRQRAMRILNSLHQRDREVPCWLPSC